MHALALPCMGYQSSQQASVCVCACVCVCVCVCVSTDLGSAPSFNRSSSRFFEMLESEAGGGPVPKKKEMKTRFQGIENMAQSSVLDK